MVRLVDGDATGDEYGGATTDAVTALVAVEFGMYATDGGGDDGGIVRLLRAGDPAAVSLLCDDVDAAAPRITDDDCPPIVVVMVVVAAAVVGTFAVDSVFGRVNVGIGAFLSFLITAPPRVWPPLLSLGAEKLSTANHQ